MTRKLLLADDSVTIRKVVELTFADEGVDVTAVANGEEAMQKFNEIQPDIVLVDVNMPEPTGYHICEMIKQDETTRHIPVVLLVGSFEPFDQGEAERVGADGFLTKPFRSIRDLVAKVEELLGPESGPPASVADTSDIDSLIHSSFAATAEIPEDEAAEMLLGDAGLDDEMIEQSYPSVGVESPQQDIGSEKELGPSEVGTERRDNSRIDVLDTLDDDAVLDLTNAADIDTLRDMDISDGEQNFEEPSEEFIDLIARRVVEKLSDKVIREIAAEAVPRIAESMMREALADENKN